MRMGVKLIIVAIILVLASPVILMFSLFWVVPYFNIGMPGRDTKMINQTMDEFKLQISDNKNRLPQNCFLTIATGDKGLDNGSIVEINDEYYFKREIQHYIFVSKMDKRAIFEFDNDNGNLPIIYEKDNFIIIYYSSSLEYYAKKTGENYHLQQLIIFNKDNGQYRKAEFIVKGYSVFDSFTNKGVENCSYQLGAGKIFVHAYYNSMGEYDSNRIFHKIFVYDFESNSFIETARDVDTRCNGFNFGVDNQYLYLQESYSQATDYFGFFSFPRSPDKFLPKCLNYRKKII